MSIKKSILQFITGRKGQLEQKALEKWKQDSSDNLHALKTLIEMNQISDELRNYRDVNNEAAWQNIEGNINKNTKIRTIGIYRVAAAVGLLVLASLFIINYSQGDHVQYHIVYNGSTVQSVSLHDQSLVTLDTKSTLEEKSFRSVSLSGRAFFKITPDKTKPFTIQLIHGEIQVLGTQFSINTDQKGTEIYVSEGKVKYSYSGQDFILVAGDIIKVLNNQISRSKVSTLKPDVWTFRTLKIENQSLQYVLDALAVYYNINLDVQTNFKEDRCRINTTITKETINHVLKELEILVGLKYEIVNNTIIIKSYKC
jgi:ferric-dicitrate binding protein FerR (iron transport regulator)